MYAGTNETHNIPLNAGVLITIFFLIDIDEGLNGGVSHKYRYQNNSDEKMQQYLKQLVERWSTQTLNYK